MCIINLLPIVTSFNISQFIFFFHFFFRWGDSIYRDHLVKGVYYTFRTDYVAVQCRNFKSNFALHELWTRQAKYPFKSVVSIISQCNTVEDFQIFRTSNRFEKSGSMRNWGLKVLTVLDWRDGNNISFELLGGLKNRGFEKIRILSTVHA